MLLYNIRLCNMLVDDGRTHLHIFVFNLHLNNVDNHFDT